MSCSIPAELVAVADRIRADPGTSRVPCPQCDRGARDTALAVTIDHRGILWHCHRCQWAGSDRGAQRAPSSPVRASSPAASASLPDTAIALWRAARPITAGTVAADYLQSRNCILPPTDGDLRWHPRVRHMSGYAGPALVALMTHAATGETLTVHRTWIRADGTKADVEPPRTYWPKLPTAQGVVRLWPNEAVTLGLGIAEGIETALALAHAFAPVWACLDAGHVAAMPVLEGVQALTIAADHDEAGIRASRACADRWADAGRHVSIIMSPTPGNDIADEVAA